MIAMSQNNGEQTAQKPGNTNPAYDTIDRQRWQRCWQQLIDWLIHPPNDSARVPVAYHRQAARREARRARYHKTRADDAMTLSNRAVIGERKLLQQLAPYEAAFQTCDLAQLQARASEYDAKMKGVYQEILQEDISAGLLQRKAGWVTGHTVYDKVGAHLEDMNYAKALKTLRKQRAGWFGRTFGDGKDRNAAIAQMYKKVNQHRLYAFKHKQASQARDLVADKTAARLRKLAKDLRGESHAFANREALEAGDQLAHNQAQSSTTMAFLMDLANRKTLPSQKAIRQEITDRLAAGNDAQFSLTQLKQDMNQLAQAHQQQQKQALETSRNHHAKHKAINRFLTELRPRRERGASMTQDQQNAISEYIARLADDTPVSNMPANPLRQSRLREAGVTLESNIILARDFMEKAGKQAGASVRRLHVPHISPERLLKPAKTLGARVRANLPGWQRKQAFTGNHPAP
jgi:hypothetical protein